MTVDRELGIGRCHACGRVDEVAPCPFWLDVDHADPALERACCLPCSEECADDI